MYTSSRVSRFGSVVKRVVLASPRGYCAGVERAVETVEEALVLWGPPLYVRKQIVHNTHVVQGLEARGAIFVDTEEDVPPGARIVFSAHGVSPAVRARARARGLRTIDATCPSSPRSTRKRVSTVRKATRSFSSGTPATRR